MRPDAASRTAIRDSFMRKLIVYADPVFEEHQPPPGEDHPEAPWRAHVLYDEAVKLTARGLIVLRKPKPLNIFEAEIVHDKSYLNMIVEASRKGYTYVASETYVSPGTVKAIEAGLGAAREAIEYACNGFIVFVAQRPPGHHAGFRRAHGFSLVNFAAYAARKAQEVCGSRVAVVDLDAHWGDGTAEIFYRDDTVLYMSLHQDPRTLFPGKGFPEEYGGGTGIGYTVNIPLPPGTGDDAYLVAWYYIAKPVLETFKPDMVIISLGLDLHRDDPLSDLGVTFAGLTYVVQSLNELARRRGHGIVFVLEGGYNAKVLRRAIRLLSSLGTGRTEVIDEPSFSLEGEVYGKLRAWIQRTRRVLSSFWPI